MNSRNTKSQEEPPLFHFFENAEALLKEVPKHKREKKKVVRSKFPGPALDAELDDARLTGLQLAIFNLMKDAKWRTHSEIKTEIGRGSENGISAMLRNLRHPKRGSHTVNKNRRGDPKLGLWEYQLIVNPKTGEKIKS